MDEAVRTTAVEGVSPSVFDPAEGAGEDVVVVVFFTF